jgi:hypothetical protein
VRSKSTKHLRSRHKLTMSSMTRPCNPTLRPIAQV